MDAFFARNRLSAYLDGELPAAEARDVEQALQRDPNLRRELEELREAVELLQDQGVVEPPAGFADRLSARLAAEPMPVGWRRWARSIRPEALLLAAAAILVVGYVGNHKSLPDLQPTEGVTAGQAFESPAGAPAEDPAAPSAAEGTKPTTAPSAAVPTANGVLGDEAPYGAPPAKKAKPSIGSKEPVEIEPWQAAWEKDPEYGEPKQSVAPSKSASANTVASNTGTGNTEIRWTSPPPFRYRVVAKDDMALKKLAEIARELGGELQDARGRKLGGFQLDQGDENAVRVAVPAHNASTLAARLRELGTVETIQETGSVLADPNADIPVAVTISY